MSIGLDKVLLETNDLSCGGSNDISIGLGLSVHSVPYLKSTSAYDMCGMYTVHICVTLGLGRYKHRLELALRRVKGNCSTEGNGDKGFEGMLKVFSNKDKPFEKAGVVDSSRA